MQYCTVCGTEVNGNFCPKCGKAAYYSSSQYDNHSYTNQARSQRQGYAPHQDSYYSRNPYAQNYSYSRAGGGPVSSKSRLAALLLCIFLGAIGVHHFYVGRVGYGILYIFTAGLFGIGCLVDLILIATGSYKDQYGFVVEDWNA